MPIPNEQVRASVVSLPPLTEEQLASLERLKKRPKSEIDFSDQPPLTDEQLASAFRPYQEAKELVAVRLDRDVLAWLRQPGRKGYSTRVNAILRAVMENAK